jgi:RNA recognition motif-containing protein
MVSFSFDVIHQVLFKKKINSILMQVYLGYTNYAYVHYEQREHASLARAQLNQYELKGRNLRVEWNRASRKFANSAGYADAKGEICDQNMERTFYNSAPVISIYVQFETIEADAKVSESLIREVFEPFGLLTGCFIKTNYVSSNGKRQYGYAFVHFECSAYGQECAQRAVEAIGNNIDGNSPYVHKGVAIRCEVSKNYRRASSMLNSADQPVYDQQYQGLQYVQYQNTDIRPYGVVYSSRYDDSQGFPVLPYSQSATFQQPQYAYVVNPDYDMTLVQSSSASTPRSGTSYGSYDNYGSLPPTPRSVTYNQAQSIDQACPVKATSNYTSNIPSVIPISAAASTTSTSSEIPFGYAYIANSPPLYQTASSIQEQGAFQTYPSATSMAGSRVPSIFIPGHVPPRMNYGYSHMQPTATTISVPTPTASNIPLQYYAYPALQNYQTTHPVIVQGTASQNMSQSPRGFRVHPTQSSPHANTTAASN